MSEGGGLMRPESGGVIVMPWLGGQSAWVAFSDFLINGKIIKNIRKDF
jgi:hypothetical protein